MVIVVYHSCFRLYAHAVSSLRRVTDLDILMNVCVTHMNHRWLVSRGLFLSTCITSTRRFCSNIWGTLVCCCGSRTVKWPWPCRFWRSIWLLWPWGPVWFLRLCWLFWPWAIRLFWFFWLFVSVRLGWCRCWLCPHHFSNDNSSLFSVESDVDCELLLFENVSYKLIQIFRKVLFEEHWQKLCIINSPNFVIIYNICTTTQQTLMQTQHFL